MATSERITARSYVGIWPTLSFHYKIPPTVLAAMPQWMVKLYVDDLPHLLAEQQLMAIEAAAMPHRKKEAQRQAIRRLQRAAERPQPEAEQGKPQMSEEQFKLMMETMGVNFVAGEPRHQPDAEEELEVSNA